MVKVPCIVAGCRRNVRVKPWDCEGICQLHWAPIPKLYRRAYHRATRRYFSNSGSASLRFAVARDRLWNRLKRAAIERSAGVA